MYALPRSLRRCFVRIQPRIVKGEAGRAVSSFVCLLLVSSFCFYACSPFFPFLPFLICSFFFVLIILRLFLYLCVSLCFFFVFLLFVLFLFFSLCFLCFPFYLSSVFPAGYLFVLCYLALLSLAGFVLFFLFYFMLYFCISSFILFPCRFSFLVFLMLVSSWLFPFVSFCFFSFFSLFGFPSFRVCVCVCV